MERAHVQVGTIGLLVLVMLAAAAAGWETASLAGRLAEASVAVGE